MVILAKLCMYMQYHAYIIIILIFSCILCIVPACTVIVGPAWVAVRLLYFGASSPVAIEMFVCMHAQCSSLLLCKSIAISSKLTLLAN